MKILLFFFLAVSTVVASAGVDWSTDYKKALVQARTEKKQVLLNFTGSDWCSWCIRLKKEAFDQPAFAKFAHEYLVLVEIDFPRTKPQSNVLKKQNTLLQTDYAVEGFPTLILLDSNGKEIRRRVGYIEGGAEGVIQWLLNGN